MEELEQNIYLFKPGESLFLNYTETEVAKRARVSLAIRNQRTAVNRQWH